MWFNNIIETIKLLVFCGNDVKETKALLKKMKNLNITAYVPYGYISQLYAKFYQIR